jgi:hypothetical protein
MRFVRRRRSVLEFSDMQKKKLLQRPTSLEIARYTSKWQAFRSKRPMNLFVWDFLKTNQH